MKYLNLYAVTRNYGGPEEGGWYYDAGEALETKPFYGTDEEAHEALAKANEDIKARKLPEIYHMGHGPHDGVDPDGNGDDHYLLPGGPWGPVKYRVRLENHPAKDYPEETPYYC